MRMAARSDVSAVAKRAVGPAGQHGGQVEPEAVDVHLRDPVAQALEDQRPGADAGAGQRIAAPGVVAVHRPAGRRTSHSKATLSIPR